MRNKGDGVFGRDNWSEIKLEIIRKYAAAYSRILAARADPAFHHIYIDGFAGPGVHRSKSSGELVAGSPANALRVTPPFREYYFIDLDEAKVASLERIARQRHDVRIYHGDCNRQEVGSADGKNDAGAFFFAGD